MKEGVQLHCGVDWGWGGDGGGGGGGGGATYIRYSYSPSQKPTQIHLIDQGWNHENFSNSLGMKILHILIVQVYWRGAQRINITDSSHTVILIIVLPLAIESVKNQPVISV